MSIHLIQDFLQSGQIDKCSLWTQEGITQVSGREIPSHIYRGQDTLLKADIKTLYQDWYIESICDPRSYPKGAKYGEIFKTVYDEIERLLHDSKKAEIKELASLITETILRRIESLNVSRRKAFDKWQRRTLVDYAGKEVRCWICGYRFEDEAVENFTAKKSYTPSAVPTFVDIMKPRLNPARDYSIEVDHVFPHSKGGEDEGNLRLACGWCNRYKSNKTSIYEAPGHPQKSIRVKGAILSIPTPIWVIRMIAVRQQCETDSGCEMTIGNSELTVTPNNIKGANNPFNLKVTCYEHDTISKYRMIHRNAYEQLIKKH